MKQDKWNRQDAEQMDDKPEADIMIEKSPVLMWLDNFWYHYKWPVIITAFFVAVLVLLIVQMVDRPTYDVTLVCAGTYRMDTQERTDYEEMLDAILPEDFDGNGEKNVNLMIYQIYSEDEYNEEVSKAEAVSEVFAINGKYNSDEFNNFSQFTMTGECSVYLLSEYLYENLRSADCLRPISELYPDGNLPEGVTQDGYGIYINQTDFYQYNPAAQAMPGDMVLCIMKPLVWGSSNNSETYVHSEEFFRSIADYRVKE